MITLFNARLYGRFIEKKSNTERKKFIKQVKEPTFLEAVLEIETM